MELILYTLFGFAGYLSLTKNTPYLFINRPSIENSKDYLMLVGRLGIQFKVLTSLVLTCVPLR